MITAEDILNLTKRDIICVAADTTLQSSLQLMLEHKIGALSVTRDGSIVGVWTERDLIRNLISDKADLKTAQIGDHMSSHICKVPHTATLPELIDKFLGLYIRHIFVEKEGEVIGIISSGDAMKADWNEKSKEIKNLTSYVSMEYYENWKWDVQKK